MEWISHHQSVAGFVLINNFFLLVVLQQWKDFWEGQMDKHTEQHNRHAGIVHFCWCVTLTASTKRWALIVVQNGTSFRFILMISEKFRNIALFCWNIWHFFWYKFVHCKKRFLVGVPMCVPCLQSLCAKRLLGCHNKKKKTSCYSLKPQSTTISQAYGGKKMKIANTMIPEWKKKCHWQWTTEAP